MRVRLLIPILALVAGFLGGMYLATTHADSAALPAPQSLVLTQDDQTDYILNVAAAYSGDGNLQLAQDRLARLHDPRIAERVQEMSLEQAAQRNVTSRHLAKLAVGLGSHIKSLVALFVTETPTATRVQPTSGPVFSNVRATLPPRTATFTPTMTDTPTPAFVVVPNSHPFYILPTNTFTPSPTPRPATRTPYPTRTPVPTDTPLPTVVPPAPYPIFEPDLSQWWGTIHFEPAEVQPGQGYWHLVHAVYCDAFDGSDRNKHNFGCDDMPGGGAGTSIYVMDGGNPIDVYAGGPNLGNDRAIVGDLKKKNDMCQCDWAIEVSNYRISVRGAPSDAMSGFCLCGKNFGWSAHAHVRYFLYFQYITR